MKPLLFAMPGNENFTGRLIAALGAGAWVALAAFAMARRTCAWISTLKADRLLRW